MSERLHFLREGIRNMRETGSIAPSSRYLCREITSKVNFLKAKVIVELGPGDGVITRFLLEDLNPDARLVIFEINDVFVSRLKKEIKDPRVIIIHDSAENMGEHFAKLGIAQVDYFVSGIPFVMLPETLAERVISECKKWLAKGGKFIQFHYSPVMVRFYKKMFGNIEFDFVPLNIPPAIVITCKNE